MRKPIVFVVALFAVVAGCHHESLLDHTIAQVERVRAGVTVTTSQGRAESVASLRRLAIGDRVQTNGTGRAVLALDGGSRFVLDHDSLVRVTTDRTASLDSGRVWIAGGGDASRSESTILAVGGALLHLRGARASVERHGSTADVSVLAGEIAFEAGGQRGAVHTGETAHLDGTHVAVATQQLFTDWTGGFADDLPTFAPDAAGLGAVAARRPDETGAPRWPMVMQRLDTHVEIHGDVAVTTIDQTFFNPSADTVEGIYTFHTPQGAVLQMFGVDRHGRTVEGIVRERQQAAAAYQAQVFVGSTHDPALLEWDAPGRYHARLYPIEGGATRRIRVRYTQWLTPDAQGRRYYRLPLSGLDTRIGELRADFDLTEANITAVRTGVGGRLEDHHLYVAQSDVMPRADLVVELQGAPPADATAAQVSAPDDPRGGFVRVEVRAPQPAARAMTDEGVDLVIVVDHSAATDPLARRLEQAFVESVIEQLDARDRVLVLAGDVGTRALGGATELRTATPETRRAIVDALASDAFGGATDLGAMIAAAHQALSPDRNGAIVYVGDGRPTVGESELPSLRQMISRLSPHPRLYAIAVGEDPQLDLLSGLAEPSGFAARITRRGEVARTALDLVSHASRPLVRNFHVDLGPDVRDVYPSGGVDLPAGEPLVVVGRYAQNPPHSVTVHATWNGSEATRTVAIDAAPTTDGDDLRFRWATLRLQNLLARGESRPVIVELGTRFHLITPFTSLYVPSEDEVSALERATPQRRPETFADLGIADFFPLVGCSRESAPAAPQAVASPSPSTPAQPASAPAAGAAAAQVELQTQVAQQAEQAGTEGRMGQREAEARPSRYAIRAPEAPPAAPPGGSNAVAAAAPPPIVAPSENAATSTTTQVPAHHAASGQQNAPTTGSFGTGSAGGGGGGGYFAHEDHGGRGRGIGGLRARGPGDSRRNTDDGDAVLGGADESGLDNTNTNGTLAAAEPSVPAPATDAEMRVASRCSDAATVPLTERVALWRERIAANGGPAGAIQIFRDARRQCELPAWADRAALLRLITDSSAGIDAQIAIYRGLSDSAARQWLRTVILRALARTGQLARAEELGLGRLDASAIAAALGPNPTPAVRLSALRELYRRNPDDTELGLRALDAAVDAHSSPDVRDFGTRLRADPQADARVRTSVGEALLAIGDETEARRSFSEIVEFAPDDPMARRRLGDIALSHGWADEAYRQFQMLAASENDAPDVLLREAMAARMANRLDEAVRLAERVAQQSVTGGTGGVADIAAAWIGTELALAAHEPGTAPDALDELRARWRRSPAARDAGAVRVVLRWFHPDDGAELWLTLPGESLRRSDTIADTIPFETTVLADAPASLTLTIRRAGSTRAHGQAELIVIWNEGSDHERVDRHPLVLDDAHAQYVFRATATSLDDVTPAAPLPSPIAQATAAIATAGGAR